MQSIFKSSIMKMLSIPDTKYFLTIFSYEPKPPSFNPALTHVFAKWVKLQNDVVTDSVTINWGPEDYNPNLFLNEVKGTHFEIKESLNYAIENNRNIYYKLMKTNEESFNKARYQRDRLTKYKALDFLSRPNAVNCMHAISDVEGYLNLGTNTGRSAAAKISEFFERKNVAKTIHDKKIIKKIVYHECHNNTK